ncbi:hypothetical protein [Iamia sp.]|uniref:hypothetical protein n=1 Tax=Iamia sp. TaxID=2722710 RepID=UPI002BF4D33C|nr:hypothetical protein [Iamia sp.]HXH56580.1 hypothetical protein [Iamia sp.]
MILFIRKCRTDERICDVIDHEGRLVAMFYDEDHARRFVALMTGIAANAVAVEQRISAEVVA